MSSVLAGSSRSELAEIAQTIQDDSLRLQTYKKTVMSEHYSSFIDVCVQLQSVRAAQKLTDQASV